MGTSGKKKPAPLKKSDAEKPPTNDQAKGAPNAEEGKIEKSAIHNFLDAYSMAPPDTPKTPQPKPPGALFDDLTLDEFFWPNIDLSSEYIARFTKIAKKIEKNIIQEAPEYRHNPDYKISYHQTLNPAQLAAVSTTKGPLLVIAGAGSGKTRTLTYRVSYLLENGVPPEKILLLTFTRKASAEMINRTMELLKSPGAKKVAGGTFHSFANYALRRFSGLTGMKPDFTIIDTTDAEDIIALIREDESFQSIQSSTQASRAFPKKNRIYEIISAAKNRGRTIGEIIEAQYSGLLEYEEDIKNIAAIFDQYKRANRLLDYDDLIEYFVHYMNQSTKFRERIQTAFDYIMVDEYQDTNIKQKEMVDLIGEKSKNVMAVGDDSQSIYSFRGANFENILTFPETYPQCKIVKIEENYRSNRGVLNFANSIISNVKIGYRKKLKTENSENIKPLFRSFFDQEGEAAYIVTKILELRDKEIELKNIAVLVRAMYHSNYIQIELLKRGIPYVVVGGIKFSERKHIRDIIAYLRIIQNPYDAPAWNRVLKLIEGVGDSTSKHIILDIRTAGGALRPENYRPRKFYPDLKILAGLIDKLTKEANSKTSGYPVSAFIEEIRKYYGPLLKKREDDYDIRMRDIEALYNFAAGYDDLEKFLTEFVLDPPSNKFQDKNEPLVDENEDTPLTISTIHSAKGLEWHSVFLPHLLDGLFPSVRSIETFEELEEERRLFYVACTRAKSGLYLTMPSFFSAWDSFMTLPSRFIAEIPRDNWIYER